MSEVVGKTLPFDTISDGYKTAGRGPIERDQWGRALIKPPPRGWSGPSWSERTYPDDRRPYASISTVAGRLESAWGLKVWEQRHVALSIARRADLIEQLQGLTYADGRSIDAICQEALTRAKDDDTDPEGKLLRAGRGTAAHAFTVPGAPAPMATLSPSCAQQAAAAEAFRAKLERNGLEIVDSEVFVVNDLLHVAGTYDHTVMNVRTGKVFVLDKKTGSAHWAQVIAQIEAYANSWRYSDSTGERSPIHPDLDPRVGYACFIDLNTAEIDLRPVDLRARLSTLASTVHYRTREEAVRALVGDPLP